MPGRPIHVTADVSPTVLTLTRSSFSDGDSLLILLQRIASAKFRPGDTATPREMTTMNGCSVSDRLLALHRSVTLLVIGFGVASPAVLAGDWPQILGPSRDAVAVGEELGDPWDKSGPEVVWKIPVGQGFAGVAVAGDRVIAFVREGENEIVRCLEAATGKVQWESKSATRYQGGVSNDKGPRCVPLISGDSIFTFGVEGLLRCVSLTTGDALWQRETTKDFRPLEGYFGVGSTPMLYKDRLIVNVGGREKASIVAFDSKSGETVWSTFTDAASYSSPVIAKFGSNDTAVVVTRMHLVGVNPADGEQKFAIPFGARGPTVNGASPVVLGNRVLVTSSYNIGSLLVEVTNDDAKELWRDEELLATQYATPVVSPENPNIVFALDGRQDAGSGSARLKCIDLELRKVLWEESGFDYGTLIRVDKELLILTCGGELIRVAASADAYREVCRSQVLNSTDSGYRLPALSNGRLYIRDDSTLKCLRVGAP
jgi:outer membrane protein assembly factor BamB